MFFCFPFFSVNVNLWSRIRMVIVSVSGRVSWPRLSPWSSTGDVYWPTGGGPGTRGDPGLDLWATFRERRDTNIIVLHTNNIMASVWSSTNKLKLKLETQHFSLACNFCLPTIKSNFCLPAINCDLATTLGWVTNDFSVPESGKETEERSLVVMVGRDQVRAACTKRFSRNQH